MGVAMTKKQLQVLKFIYNFKCDNGYSPTYAEIAVGAKLSSTASVTDVFKRLKLKGYINYMTRSPRSVEIVKLPDVMVIELNKGRF